MSDLHAQPRRFRLDVCLPRPVPVHFHRHPVEQEIPALGELMWAAYRGTPDERDAGDGVESATLEVRLAFDGAHGTFLADASFVADQDGRPVAAAAWSPSGARCRCWRTSSRRPRAPAGDTRGG